MSVPAFKNSRSKVRRRRSHHALTAVQLNTCTKCESPVISHRACAKCGNYNGRQVIKTTEEVLDKKAKKTSAKKKAVAKDSEVKA